MRTGVWMERLPDVHETEDLLSEDSGPAMATDPSTVEVQKSM